MEIAAHISLFFKTTGRAVVPASIKFVDGIGYLGNTIHEHHFSWCQDLHFSAVSYVADTPHPTQQMVLIIQPFQSNGTLVDVVTMPSP